MGKKPGRRSKNRAPKLAPQSGVVEEVLGPIIPTREDKYMSLDRPPMHFIHKITGVQRNFTTNTIIAHSISLEDTIRPVELRFPAPMQEFSSDPKGFGYHWERMTYLFELDDPADFSSLRELLDEPERKSADRFLNTCRNLASYSVVNEGGSLKLSSRGGDWTFYAELPSHEAFAGFSATFRQVHNDMENASFTKVWKILNRAAGGLKEADAAEARVVLKTWKKARAQLMQKMAATMVCERLQANVRADAPKSFMGVVPDDIIKIFNYGDSLHWGDYRDELAGLTDDPYNENFHKHACVVAMVQLSHFYFGFAELVAGALGVRR